MIRWSGLILLALTCVARADERLGFCHNWSCAAIVAVEFPESFLKQIGELLRAADTAEREREALAVAVGRVYRWAGERSVIGGDRAGNDDDAETEGRMDCIDHSTNTTGILRMFEGRGWLRFHRSVEPRFRSRLFVLPVHRAAIVEEVPRRPLADDPLAPPAGEFFAVDSWLVDPGVPVVVQPLADWLHWGEPHVR